MEDNETDLASYTENITVLSKILKNDLHEGPTSISLIVCIGIFGVFGNSFAIFILCHSTSMRKKLINVFLINQSAIDLAASVFLVTLGYNKTESKIVTFSGIAADLYCKLIGSQLPLWAMSISSSWNLVFVNLERFLSVVYPIFHKTGIKKWHIATSVVSVWLIGIIYMFFFTYWTSGFSDGVCLTASIWPSDTAAIIAGAIGVCVSFLMPFVIMVFLYVLMIEVIKSKNIVNVTSNQTQQNSQQNKTNTKTRNILKTLALITLVFIICYIPNNVLYLIFLTGKDDVLAGHFYTFTIYLLFLNCCINPVIYSAQYKDFQIQAKKLFSRRVADLTEGQSVASEHRK